MDAHLQKAVLHSVYQFPQQGDKPGVERRRRCSPDGVQLVGQLVSTAGGQRTTIGLPGQFFHPGTYA